MAIDCNHFIDLQYTSLRQEIETSKANMFKLIVGGSAVIPTAQSVANIYSIGAVTLAIPLIVVVLVLLFLAENRSVMRTGTYIKEQIEPKVEGIICWETWLSSVEGGSSQRTVERLLITGFSILASSYFVASVVIAARYALQEFGQHGQLLLGGIYVGIGLVLVLVLYSQAQIDTTAKE